MSSAGVVADGPPIRRLDRKRALQLRALWRAFIGLTLGLFAVSLPARFDELTAVAVATETDVTRLFPASGVLELASAPGVYPWIVISLETIFVAFFAVTSTGIAWGRSDVPAAMFFSAVFVGYSVWVTPTTDALRIYPALDAVSSLAQALGLWLALSFFLLFPDGRFVPRWSRFGALFWGFYCLSWGLFPESWFSLKDPFTATTPMFVLLMIGWSTGMMAQYVRYRADADSRQRRQTKWVLVVIGGAIAAYGSIYVADLLLPTGGTSRLLFDLFGNPLFWLLAIPIPIALSGAMMRHNLFDFRAVVNRTIVYATLTAVLAAAYFGLSVSIGALVPVAEDSPLIVALSTLVVVTLFRPLRGRIQVLIDQRFYRSKYDATRVVERFGTKLRHENDLPAVATDLCRAVVETMQPTHVSLWVPVEKRESEATA